MPPSRLIFGCGYLGVRTARLWGAAGDLVIAYSRSCEPTFKLGVPGLQTRQGDVTRPETIASIGASPAKNQPPIESLLYAVGYDRTAGPDIHAVYAGGLRNVLTAIPRSVTRAIYISTTGVYGSADGDWVDEQTPPDPQRDGGRASLAAEQVLAAHALGKRSAILRLAGIYGPGRVPYLHQLRAGEPIAAPSAGWLNLIHVDDAAAIVVAVDHWLAERPAADGPHVFCVSDGAPVQRGQYYAEAARLIGAPPPQFTQPPADSPAAARAASDRRVRNDKLRRAFDVKLAYPSYRDGLASILATM
jgi:nucleoside-diphosphate-sugar epimerase